MGTKLHPPYPNQECLPVQNLDPKSALQCLKKFILWSCAGIGRFSLWHSWLIWVNWTVNSAEFSLNARVPTAPNSPESSCAYLAVILSANELNPLWASSTVRLLTGTDMITIRMHSNRMRTSCSLTVCCSLLPGGVLPCGGFSLAGGFSPAGGSPWQGEGGSLWQGGSPWQGGFSLAGAGGLLHSLPCKGGSYWRPPCEQNEWQTAVKILPWLQLCCGR